ncbi:MAG: TonB-dependent receptor [Melioribacteraceae bacterium]|nr:TonB-dependent receptor [Melioribacteraceae bacterium]MCF8353334.1 TonB-dependent receptor [Melioribacteraceae bacterium]MCF8393198.1 TonB-dependent receptor [Melioribacteraceae bacterium]MCF8419060.1 TonB-dependent receptor [Melioribacteraceae bacterium]
MNIYGMNYRTLEVNFSGIIIDLESNEPVEGAAVHILENDLFSTSDKNGKFNFSEIEEMIYSVEISHVAYKTKKITIDLSDQRDRAIIIYLEPKTIEISQIVVSTEKPRTLFEDMEESSNVLKGRELEKALGYNLAATLKNETGLAIRSMGPAPARPVIRGLGGDRVVISEDGGKTVDLSATSADHAVTVETFSVERIEVLRGPQVLLHSPTTIGGIVNVVRNEIPTERQNNITGNIGGYWETANSGLLGSGVVTVPVKNFSFRGEFSHRHAGDISTPIGTLKNSYSDNLNMSAGAGYIYDFGVLGFSYRNYELDYGVPGGFVGAHPGGVDIEMIRKQFNGKFIYNFESGLFENLEADFSRVYYRHKEFEASGNIGAEFRILDYLGRVQLNHRQIGFLTSGSTGISAEYRDFNIGGLVFTTPAKLLNLSAFLFEHFTTGNFHYEFAARYNIDKIDPLHKIYDDKLGQIKERNFSTYSFSFSTMYQLSEVVHFGANISKSSRVPTIEELFSRGPHLAAYSYEIGNPNLPDESGLGVELFVYHKFSNFFFNFNLFRNDINSYIIPRNTGEKNYQTFLSVYQTSSVDAVLQGFEGQIEYSPYDFFTISANISYTSGKYADNSKNLPQIPPLKSTLELKFSYENFSVSSGLEGASSQRKVDDFEQPTSGYIILNSTAQYSFQSGDLIHNISLNLDNIFNKEYRNHLSRVKSILPEAGRNVRLTYKMFFVL